MSWNAALILGYFGLLIGGFVLHSRPIAHPWLFLLRGFFPKWQFFHSLVLTPRLYVRHQRADDHWSDWRKFTPRARRRLIHLLHNPQVNLALTEQTLVEHLANDIAACADGGAAGELVSYRMVERLARQKVGAESGLCAYQFRLCLERPGAPDDPEADMILLSPILPWEA